MGRNYGGKGGLSPISKIKVSLRGTRRKRRGMHLRQKNRVVITFKERVEARPGKIQDDRRRTEGYVNI